jgi:hypothetical protein
MEKDSGGPADEVMAYYRTFDRFTILVIHNLSSSAVRLKWNLPYNKSLLDNDPEISDGKIKLKGFEYFWLVI